MPRVFQIILEILKRPHLWNVENPCAGKIADALIAEKVYSGQGANRTRDQRMSVEKYLEFILEVKKHVEAGLKSPT